MNPIFSAALEVQEFCLGKNWRFCFIGAIAVQRWGEPRLTLDVDLTVLTGFGNEEAFIDSFLEEFPSRIPDARQFGLENRVLLIEGVEKIPIDVALGAMPFEERAVGRASAFPIAEGVSLTTCSAEDLIVFKAFAGRDKDWLDVEGIIIRQAGKLDEGVIWGELKPLVELKQEPGISERLRDLLERHRI
ncbi:MAG: hypothetical protein ACRD1X_04560 [Vicinamibacteria bacterium]